jgi:hypothetical protein
MRCTIWIKAFPYSNSLICLYTYIRYFSFIMNDDLGPTWQKADMLHFNVPYYNLP